MIPTEEQLTLDAVAQCIRESPIDLGITANAQIKSVLVPHPTDGRWINHYTVLRAGAEDVGSLSDDFTADRIRLVKKTFAAGAFTNGKELLRLLTSWQDADLTGGAFQQTVNTNHQHSSNRLSEYPCWFMDISDNRPDLKYISGPRGPFKKIEKKFLVEDLAAAVTRWAGDPSSQDQTVQNVYRVILPDKRAYFTKKAFDGHTLRFSVAGKHKDKVSCTFSTGRGEEPEWKEVLNGEVEFHVMGSPRHLEAFLIDEHQSWCDRYWNPLEPTNFLKEAAGNLHELLANATTVDEQTRGVFPGDASVTETLQGLHSQQVYSEWQLAMQRRVNDPRGAITLARTLLESTCKHILDERQVSYTQTDSLRDLHRKASDVLGLAPGKQTDPAFRQIVSGVASVVGALEEIRNKIGDAHGKAWSAEKPLERHAHLAVNLSGAVAVFLAQAHEAQANDRTP